MLKTSDLYIKSGDRTKGVIRNVGGLWKVSVIGDKPRSYKLFRNAFKRGMKVGNVVEVSSVEVASKLGRKRFETLS